MFPKTDMDGLADYDRSGGYADGDDRLTCETMKFDYDKCELSACCSCVLHPLLKCGLFSVFSTEKV